MKRVLKFVGKVLLWIVLLAVAAVATVPLWIEPVAKLVATTLVPKLTKTSFALGRFSFNPYTGRLAAGGILLGNPEGYSEPTAVSLENLAFDIDMSTLGDEYVHIEEITVSGLFASYVMGGQNGTDNLTQIKNNLSGGKVEAKDEEAKAQAKAKGEIEAKGEEAKGEAEAKDEEAKAKKFVIDRLTVSDVRVSFGLVTVPLPVDIVLTDVGKKSNGVTFVELCDQVWQAVFKQAMALNDGAKLLGAMLGEGAGKTLKSASDGGAKALNDVGKTVEALKGLFK